MNDTVDHLIVGGGVYGCATAWHLAQQGAEVTLLEAGDIAREASGGIGTRGVRANSRDYQELPLMRLAYELWPELSGLLDQPGLFERRGQLTLVENRRYWEAARIRQQVQEASGIPSRLLGKSEVLELEPSLTPNVLGAVLCPLDGVSAHQATTTAYARAASRNGATVQTKTRVDKILWEEGVTRGVVLTNGQLIEVKKHLLLLNNAGVSDLIRESLGYDLPVWKRYPQAILYNPSEPIRVRHLVGHSHRTLSLKQVSDGRLMISGGWSGRVDAKGTHPDPTQVEGNLREARAVFPALEQGDVESVHVDRVETQSLDGLPIIDRIGSNLFVATGWSGHGWAIAPAVSALLAEWILNGDHPELLHPFRLNRFPCNGLYQTRPSSN